MPRLSAREAAFLALDTYFRTGVFIDDGLERFKKELSVRDFALSYEIATGVVRRKNALDALASKHAALPKKRQEKVYHSHSGFPGGLKETNFDKLQAKDPTRIIEIAVKGMLPKNPLGRAMLSKLKVYVGSEHPHIAQQPTEINLVKEDK